MLPSVSQTIAIRFVPRLPTQEQEQEQAQEQPHPIPSSSSASSAVPDHSPSVSSLQLARHLPPPRAPSTRQHRSKAPLSSSARCIRAVARPSSLLSTTTTTTELEHGFTTDEDFDPPPVLSDLALRSLAGAPMPALHELLGQQLSPSDRSSPSRPDHPSGDPHADQPVPSNDHHSSSSRLSKPSRLSDENLQRQSTGIKERVKRSVKMRDTERWARETASNPERSPSPRLLKSSSAATRPVQAMDPPPSEAQDRNLSAPLPLSPSQLTSYTHACPSPETLPRPRLSVHPVPSFRAIPTAEPGTESVIPSEHATINDWQSENTNLAGSSQFATRPIFPLSPIDVQFIGQTPTSLELQSFNLSPPIVPGTFIAQSDQHKHVMTSHFIPIAFPPFSPPSHQRPSQSSPRIEEIPLTPPTQPTKEDPDPLLRARLNLQAALATTSLSRSSPHSSSSPTTSPVAHYPRQSAGAPHLDEEESQDDDINDDVDYNQDNESGLSPIKEDRTAELAAEHSWRIKLVSSPGQHSSNQSANQPKSIVSLNLLDRIENAENQHSSISQTHRCNVDSSIASKDLHKKPQPLVQDQSTPSTTLISLEGDHSINNPAEPNNPNGDTGNLPQDIAHVQLKDSNNTAGSFVQETSKVNNLGMSNDKKDLLTGSNSTDDEPHSRHKIPHPVLSNVQVVQQMSSPKEETHPHHIPTSSPLPSTTTPPLIEPRVTPSDPESLLSRRQASSVRSRTGSHQRPNPPLSVPASARRPPPEDLLSRLEMEEWRTQTGIDDRYSLSLRPTNCSSSYASASGSLSMNSALDFDKAGLVALGGEERRGIKDRWGNSWGLESHILSPLSEHTELTTVGSILSLSTRKSNHSLRSLDSTSNSIAQRLDQADSNPTRMMKLGGTLMPSGVIRSTQTNVVNRSVSGPINRIDSPTKLTPLLKTESSKDPVSASLLEEKLKRREERRLKREKREKRKAQELKSSESLAQKQERRRLEKKKKEEFLEKKHQILQRIHETGEDAKVVRDLGILYMSSKVGVAGLKLAIRHLEMSLQMDDSDPLSWSCLGKTWAHLHAIPDTETPKITNFPEASKAQQAHNATIGLRKAIINSRTYYEVIKYKTEWARFLEKVGRWRDTLGLIGELLKNLGKSEFKCWANLGFTGLRIVFGWPPLNNLEADDLEQGFTKEQENDDSHMDFFATQDRPENLSDSDRIKLLVQVHNSFERAVTLIDERIVSHHLTHLNNVNRGTSAPAGDHPHHPVLEMVETIDRLKAYKSHYQLQLRKVRMVQKKLEEQDVNHLIPGPSRLIRDHAPHMSLSSTQDFSNETSNVDIEGADTTHSFSKNGGEDMVTEEVHECNSTSPRSHSSSPTPSIVPIFHDRQQPPHEVPLFAQPAPPLETPNCLGLSNPVPRPGILSAENEASHAPRIQNDGKIFEQSSELPSCSTSKQFVLPDGDVSSSDGPEVVVQYDDVDTTNDYSERSRNSEDPFRPSSNLGHHHFIIAEPFLITQPTISQTPVRPSSAPGCSSSIQQDPINDSKLSHSNEHVDPHHPDDHHNHANFLPQNFGIPHPSLREEINLAPENESGLRPDSSSTVKNVLEKTAITSGEHVMSATPVDGLPDSSVERSAGLVAEPKQAEACKDDESENNNNTKNNFGSSTSNRVEEEEAEEGRERHNRTPDKFPPSFNAPPDSENSLNHKISNMGLSTPVQRKLRGLDKEKLIAFLELDSEYHSKVSKLRKQLIQIEEEREVKRKEIFEKFGIPEIYYDQQDHGMNLTDREELEKASVRESVRRCGLGISEESKGNEEDEGIREGDSRAEERSKDVRRALGSSFSSIRSSSSVPSRAKLNLLRHHQHLVPMANTKEFIPNTSRSVCSPIQRHEKNTPSLRGRAFSLNGLGTEAINPTSLLSHSHHRISGADISCNSTTVNDTGSGVPHSIGNHSPIPPAPGSSDSNQASIALQGIAAILKLATSTQST